MNRGKLMIIEDDMFSMNILRKSIQNLNYTVTGTATNGEDAIRIFKQDPPAVVIMDFNIQGELDGSDLAGILRKISTCSFIFITATEDENSLKKIMASKPDAYIQKPFEFRELKAVLELAFYKYNKDRELNELLISLDSKVKERTAELNKTLDSMRGEVAAKEKAQEQLEEALKAEKKFSELKSGIISNLSHEFKTPLSTIRSSSQLINRLIIKEKFDKLNTNYTDRIEKAVDSLVNILDSILMVENTANDAYEVKISAFDLKELIAAVLEELEHADCKNVMIKRDFSFTNEKIRSDLRLIRLIISNLLSNACKYSQPEGEVRLRVMQSGEAIDITISDDGIGMSEEDQQQIFRRFHRGANVASIEGTGIGMSITQRCIEALKGSIHLESALKKGTTFKVNIPLTAK
jgi:signal transduction histidine kinase